MSVEPYVTDRDPPVEEHISMPPSKQDQRDERERTSV